MEKQLSKPYDKEHMRMAMLNHEATFKEQVYELHRLYQIQKILMNKICTQKPQRKHDPEQRPISAVDYSAINKIINIGGQSDGEDCNGDGVSEVVIDESEIELTLGPASYNPKIRRRRRRPEGRNDSDNCRTSFSSSSTGSSQTKRTAGVPETASLECQVASKSSSNVEEELRLKQPPWFFQVLSMNIT